MSERADRKADAEDLEYRHERALEELKALNAKLLEALEGLRRLGWGNPATNSQRIIGIGGELDQAIAQARAAIKEAKGET